jgi:hypothetical protein
MYLESSTPVGPINGYTTDAERPLKAGRVIYPQQYNRVKVFTPKKFTSPQQEAIDNV